ncbi:NAD(P)/FAD-dependent oxidoreductase [Streptomyces sp. AV19]|uniref:NAD(P)/FAD-dependent oxidoreductase n=1 Tax=Streptomyces sp. AV19 TaxID=2793068 RepID=UPI0018FE4AA8|nr:NAD(P)/FAD-dependent oxidoreductase [Streptomyces sp. AV19]MBH1934217.1 NAD(P)/FAD-dependent oxidoreductase [Streptomyces sp. AV19]MDG4536482.1 NAD(P)/FAD-dependent oxidoreductase [Streptomyces sp. AV19]
MTRVPARHAVVLADPDPIRRSQLQEGFTRWYGDQFLLVPTARPEDTARTLDDLARQGTHVVLVAAVDDEPVPVPGTGRLRLAPAAEDPADLDPRVLDGAVEEWWQRATPEQRAGFVPVTVRAPYRSPEAFEIRSFLAGSGAVFLWRDPEPPGDPDVHVLVGDTELPPNPSLAALADALHLVDRPTETWFDVIVIGGGPAGLSAAIYAGTQGLRTLVVEDRVPGGQVTTNPDIANCFGFPDGISGYALARRALKQAREYQVAWQPAHHATDLRIGDDRTPHEVVVDGMADRTYKAGALIIASGLVWRRLDDVPGLKPLVGRGVYYSALPVDAPRTQGDHVAVVGGGNSAGHAALFFAQYAEDVTMIVRAGSLREKMAAYLVDLIEEFNKPEERIHILTNSDVTGCAADSRDELAGIEITNSDTHEVRRLDARWLYVLIGGEPDLTWAGPAALDRIGLSAVTGAVLTGTSVPGRTQALVKAEEQAREEGEKLGLTGRALEKYVEQAVLKARPASTATSVPGIYAAGDVQSGAQYGVSSAVGQGATAIGELFPYIARHPNLFPSFAPKRG